MALDLTKPTAPPRKVTQSKQPAIKQSNQPEKSMRQTREEGCNEFFMGVSYLTANFGLYADSGTLSLHGPKMAEKLAEISEENEKVASAVDYLTKASPLLELVFIFGTFGLQIAANHKLIPADKFGDMIQDPETIASQVKTELMRQKTEVLKRQKAQQEEMQRLQAEILNSTNGNVPTEVVNIS